MQEERHFEGGSTCPIEGIHGIGRKMSCKAARLAEAEKIRAVPGVADITGTVIRIVTLDYPQFKHQPLDYVPT